MKNSFPIFLLSLNFVDGTTIVKNIEDISLTEGKGTVSRVLQTFMEVATKTSDVTELCFVLKDGLCDVDAGVEGHLLQQLGQGVHLQFRDVALGLGLDEVSDAGCYWHLIGKNIQRRKIVLVTSKKLKTSQDTFQVFLIRLEVRGEVVGISGMLDATEFVAKWDRFKWRNELVPVLQNQK